MPGLLRRNHADIDLNGHPAAARQVAGKLIFNNDAGIAAAILDRFLHRAETVVLEGKSYRMKDRPGDESVA